MVPWSSFSLLLSSAFRFGRSFNTAVHHGRTSTAGLQIQLPSKIIPSPPSRFVATTTLSSTSADADVAETMRVESEKEMERVAGTIPGDAPTRLIRSKDQLNHSDITNYLFDCDGVLYRGTDAMPSASSTIKSLIDDGKKVFFVTNNAASSRSELKEKLEKVLRCPNTLTDEMMIGSAYVAAQYLRSKLPNDYPNASAKVHVIGTSGLCGEVMSAGFEVSGGPDSLDTPSGMSRDELADYSFPEGAVDALVVGLDNDFNYRKLCIANVLLQRNPDALFVATNLDAYDLVGADARHLPGNGALVAALEACCGRTAVNVGKPSSVLAAWIAEHYKLDAQRTMMVGDRLDTDVKFGNMGRMGCSALVLTGCTTASDLSNIFDETEDGVSDTDMIPTVIFPHIGYLIQS